MKTETGFTVHDKQSAPEDARPLLDKVEQGFGFVPNIMGVGAEAPAWVEAYLSLGDILGRSSLSKEEQQVVLLSVSTQNRCDYCVAAHTASGERAGVAAEVIEAIRAGTEVPDAKLEALRRFTQAIVDKRGWVSEADVQGFLDAGFTRAQVLEVLVGVSMKTLSNYLNHMAETPLDEPLKAKAPNKAA